MKRKRKKYTVSDKVLKARKKMAKYDRNMNIVRLLDEGKTKEEIGVMYKISGQRVEQIKKSMQRYLPE